MRNLEYWLTEEELENIYTAKYWNDIQEEKKKAWWIEDGKYQRCLDYLKISGLRKEFDEAIELSGVKHGSMHKVVDLASGICWTSALLTKLPSVAEVHAVDISEHRIGRLAPYAFEMLNGDRRKFYRYLGSFYDIDFDEEEADYIFMTQAFHHADRPLHLLVECDRILRGGGHCVLVGEHYISFRRIIRRYLGNLVKRKKITKNFIDLFTPDPILGDHYYRVSDYGLFFRSLGYEMKVQYIPETDSAIYIGEKP